MPTLVTTRCELLLKSTPVFSHCVSFTFSVSVQTWMALGMRRAVFSFVIEQMSFSRTVSYAHTHTHTQT